MCYVLKKTILSFKTLCRLNVQNFYKPQFLRFFGGEATALKRKEVSSKTLEAKYTPKNVEPLWYDWWEKQNYFKPSKSEVDSFTILLPPPNITGTLHLGHALTTTIQDVIIRWKRMKGESALWIPGIDHAGIATQVAVEKYLNQTLGVSKYDLGKSEFIKKIWEWKEEKESKIIDQLRSLGTSLDWTKLAFTMDPTHCKRVTDTFIQLFNEGLIYRKEDFVNWSCALKSSISDIEVDWVNIKERTKINVPGYERSIEFGVMYKFAYKICDEDEEVIVSTTRPETMLGDVAVAIHPDDSSYLKYKDKHLWHPFRNVKIPVIFDASVNQSLGTRAVKITPSHSFNDFQIALKHNLERIKVINEEGLINNVGRNLKFHGLRRFHARNVILDELKALGLFRGLEEHSMRIPVCSRSGDVVEPLLKEQWFMNCNPLAENAVNAVKNGNLKLEPESYTNVWYEWLCSVREWNLSRQLWWGHQIPMYECKNSGKKIWVPALNLKEAELKASEYFNGSLDGVSITQDSDVLDTWFSSALLPLAVGGNLRDKSCISLMVTGHDILFFWVARMVMLVTHLTGKLPFQEVLLHSLVGDADGKKMTKSLGNVIYPEDVINGCSASEMKAQLEKNLEKGFMTKKDFEGALVAQKKMLPNGIPPCGVDALRFTLCSRDFRSQYINFDINLCLSNSYFGNKIWQAMKYFIKITDNYKSGSGCVDEFHVQNFEPGQKNLNWFDKWILSRLAATVEISENGIASHRFFQATQAIRFFLVEEFCSVYLESSKLILREASPSSSMNVISISFHCLETSLRLLSPFMPFISEHLYQALPPLKGFAKAESITISKFPSPDDWIQFRDSELDLLFDDILKLLKFLRKVKVTYQMAQARPDVFIECSDRLASILFGELGFVIKELARMRNISRVNNFHGTDVIQGEINEGCTAYVPHNKDKESLLNIFGSALNKEGKLRTNLDKMLKTTSEANWDAKPSEEKAKQSKEIKNLQKELAKISEFKQVIENCSK